MPAHSLGSSESFRQKNRCLIVDDSRFDRLNIKHSARGTGLQFIEAATVAEARAHLERGEIDLVILDRNLPDGDGTSLAREFRDSFLFEDVPVIMISGLELEDAEADAKQAGCFAYLQKDAITPKALEEMLRRCFGRSIAMAGLEDGSGMEMDSATSDAFRGMLQNFGEAFLVERQKPLVDQLRAIGSRMERAAQLGDADAIAREIELLYGVADQMTDQVDSAQ